MKTKFYVMIAIIIAVAIVGCGVKKTEDSIQSGVNEQETEQQLPFVQLQDYLHLMDADKLHLYDEYGNVVTIYDPKYIKDIAKQFTQLEIVDIEGNYLYSGGLWLGEVEYSFQVSLAGLKINDSVYTFTMKDNAANVISTIEDLILTHYWDSIADVDRIYINADDIVRTIAVNDIDIPTIIEILKKSELQEGKSNLAPEFPNYSLELSLGAKAQIKIRLINSEEVSLLVGGREIIYRASEDLWNIIHRQFPIPTYSNKDVYHLFNSTSLVISKEGKTVNGSDANNDNLVIKGVRDQIVRELLIAIPSDEQVNDDVMQLIYNIEGHNVIVNVSNQGFEFDGTMYRSIDIKERIIQTINLW